MHTPDYWYGIDLGGTKMELVACDAALTVRHRQRIPTPHDYHALVAALTALVRDADAALGVQGVPPPVGIGVPGIVDAAGRHLCANIACLTGRVLLPVLHQLLDRAITLGNDCQCFALSEAHGGAGAGADSLFGLIIGTGAGAGYVVDGRLVRGRHGAAGEWGHWPLDPHLLRRHELPLLPCACGRAACLERYVSGTGLRDLHAHLAGGAGHSAEQLAALYTAGDELAARVFDLHLDLLGAALAHIILAYDPHVVVLGGGLSQLPHLYTGLPAAIVPHLIPGLGVPPILPPAFGDAGGARGAALLARQAFITSTQES